MQMPALPLSFPLRIPPCYITLYPARQSGAICCTHPWLDQCSPPNHATAEGPLASLCPGSQVFIPLCEGHHVAIAQQLQSCWGCHLKKSERDRKRVRKRRDRVRAGVNVQPCPEMPLLSFSPPRDSPPSITLPTSAQLLMYSLQGHCRK